MKEYIQPHPWHVLEEGFHPEHQEVSESLCSLGNGRFGVRGNFEERYSGASLRGSYFAGVYYPDLTRVGWWKNGYPEYFAKVLNAVNWMGIDIRFDDIDLDLAKIPVKNFRRELDMQHGILRRSFSVPQSDGELHFSFERFCSMADPDMALIRTEIRSVGFQGDITLTPYLDFDVHNKDSNYGDQFWTTFSSATQDSMSMVSAKTKKTDFVVSSFAHSSLTKNNQNVKAAEMIRDDHSVANTFLVKMADGDQLVLQKTIINLSSLYVDPSQQEKDGFMRLHAALNKTYEAHRMAHEAAWQKIWDGADIVIAGNVKAQQGIRFNIFHLWQTYTGEDARLNIGPKGFTGEKYGGSTYWDTEAYCIPFYLSTADARIARNLLRYRFLHLPKAIENAEKLGFSKGAALYPMVTINGEECHNEWEITFEEIHRNGAMVYAIYDYIRYTGDDRYLLDGGLEVIIGVARFWSQRFNFSTDKRAWVMLGVTGPNEYENNVNNNWYTNYLAKWCMDYAVELIRECRGSKPEHWQRICAATSFRDEEIEAWTKITSMVYLPQDENRGLYLQQDGFLDKEIIPVSELPADERPLNQKWSWDRILRSCYIKQADVLQGFYFFEDHFDEDTHRRHFDFYEPLTVHESSLSPCVHAILASRLGKREKANEMYLRTSRLDIDNYNNDTEDGLHITSMAGTWMAVVRGFAGLKVSRDELLLSPVLPDGWEGFSFVMHYRERILHIRHDRAGTAVTRASGNPLDIVVHGERRQV